MLIEMGWALAKGLKHYMEGSKEPADNTRGNHTYMQNM